MKKQINKAAHDVAGNLPSLPYVYNRTEIVNGGIDGTIGLKREGQFIRSTPTFRTANHKRRIRRLLQYSNAEFARNNGKPKDRINYLRNKLNAYIATVHKIHTQLIEEHGKNSTESFAAE